MGIAQLCYGIAFDDDTKFPWGENGNIESWWVGVIGFKPTVEICDNRGNWIGGTEPSADVIKRYYKEYLDFILENELPIEIVTHGHCDFPVTILAVKETVISAYPGHPKEISASDFQVPLDGKAALLKFCYDYGIEYETGPRWWMSCQVC